ncbi:MAG: hypothetical protein K0R71_408 [Bacillales bacterium]|nr:hypothetical protein [Bacillales bacterium]
MKSSLSFLQLVNMISKLLLILIVVSSSLVFLPGITYEYNDPSTKKTILFKNMNIDNTNVLVLNDDIPVEKGKTVLMKKVIIPPTVVVEVPKKEIKKTKVELPKVKYTPPVVEPVKVVSPPKEETAPIEKPYTPPVKEETTPGAIYYRDLDVRYPSQVTAAEIDNFIQTQVTKYKPGQTSLLIGRGQQLIDTATKAGINQLIFAAMTIHESGYATSPLSHTKFNIFSVAAFTGQNAWDSAYRYSSIDQAINYQAHFLKSGYLNAASWKFKGYTLGYKNRYPNGDKLIDPATNKEQVTRDPNYSTGMNFYYAGDGDWGIGIAGIAEAIHPYKAEEYSGASMMTGSTSPVILNDFYDDWSNLNILGQVKNVNGINLYPTNSDSATAVGALAEKANFKVLGKTNNHYLKIEYLGNTYYIRWFRYTF